MKPTHIRDGEKVAVIKVKFVITAYDLERVIQELLDLYPEKKITKKDAWNRVSMNYRRFGTEFQPEDFNDKLQAQAEELSKKLFPQFYETQTYNR